MKILLINWHDVKNPYSGGAEVHLHEIFSRIAQWGNEVELLCCSTPRHEVIDGIKVLRIGNRNNFNFYVPSAVRHLLAENKYDIVIEDINKFPFFTPLYVRNTPRLILIMHLFGPAIYKETNPIFGSYINFGERLVPILYRKEMFCVLSGSTKEELIAKGIPGNNISIISPALSSQLNPDFSKKTPNPTILLYGRMKKYKRPDVAVYMMKDIVTKIPDAKLIVMGKGDYLLELIKLSQKLGLSASIKFLGFVPEDEKDKILQSVWVMVNPSLKEGWGITNIEANACGTPVVASNSPGLRDSVVDGETGFLVPQNDTNLLSKRVMDVLQDEKLRERLSLNAVKWAKSFSWDDASQKTLSLIKSIIKVNK